uniref:Uncharacterized protein n=1 Tax=Trichinella nativa TaxID=6335 RepID=A0A0V1JMX7_9BILA
MFVSSLAVERCLNSCWHKKICSNGKPPQDRISSKQHNT